ncbi:MULTISPECIES: deoxyribose-phosphate aldolase [unclassified Leptolyngbya]|uniref:deoxyribose-phosphate aldolase n=1 Tax=unclassified Leptolyngbya TaxID=2650499 RepID=UPI0016845CB0|nr:MULTISPECIES: deoxyribose-phosphate aldolase [unclassified Leptolyngbya]MBD1910139.1 deoxyribose-phosphate aldolase [Leptolyngbya sp. FACHB-8]MBD2153571.1 deoxyribose-phosphate aldolase [Leptolyngbya sp. FACHB-16]
MAKPYVDLDLAGLIDHSFLLQTATPEQIAKICEEADRFRFAAVCVLPTYVRQAVDLLKNKSPNVCTVIGFPTGANTSAVKLYEAQEAAESGATELDVVLNLGLLKTGQSEAVYKELAEIKAETGQVMKVILETGLLTDAEKKLAAEISMDAGADFVKTSTGWLGGATVADVRLLKEVTRDRIGIKASGGIRTVEQALDLVMAGATRLGTSQGVQLINQLEGLDLSQVEEETLQEY